MRVSPRISLEFFVAALAAKRICAATGFESRSRTFRIDLHSADGVRGFFHKAIVRCSRMADSTPRVLESPGWGDCRAGGSPTRLLISRTSPRRLGATARISRGLAARSMSDGLPANLNLSKADFPLSEMPPPAANGRSRCVCEPPARFRSSATACIGKPRKNVGQVAERVDAMPLATGSHAEKHGRGTATIVAAD